MAATQEKKLPIIKTTVEHGFMGGLVGLSILAIQALLPSLPWLVSVGVVSFGVIGLLRASLSQINV